MLSQVSGNMRIKIDDTYTYSPTAHKGAYENVNVRLLHRDISSGNILIGPDGRGLLIDWEFAKKVTDAPRQPRGGSMAWRVVREFLLCWRVSSN
jgi:serine/threonine protein kinase